MRKAIIDNAEYDVLTEAEYENQNKNGQRIEIWNGAPLIQYYVEKK